MKQCAAKASITVFFFSASHVFVHFQNIGGMLCSWARNLTLHCSSETVRWTAAVLQLPCKSVEYTVSADYSWINAYLSSHLKKNACIQKVPSVWELLNCIKNKCYQKNDVYCSATDQLHFREEALQKQEFIILTCRTRLLFLEYDYWVWRGHRHYWNVSASAKKLLDSSVFHVWRDMCTTTGLGSNASSFSLFCLCNK